MSNILDRITMVPLPDDQYLNEASTKRQIFIHHTASSPSPYGVLEYWKQTPERVATAFIVGGAAPVGAKWNDGDILQCYGSAKWAWHLGLTSAHLAKGAPGQSNNVDMNKMSIGIEICNWGQLTKTDKGFKSYAGTIVPDNQVVTYPVAYKGYTHYQKYTDQQIETVGALVKYLATKYSIPTEFKGMEMFDVDPRCLRGEHGVWTHTSCRPDKFDCHPQPELISMLKSLQTV